MNFSSPYISRLPARCSSAVGSSALRGSSLSGAALFRSARRLSLIVRYTADSLVASPSHVLENMASQEMLLPMPRVVEGLVDDPCLHNPLQRAERLGTRWFGCILEFEGVIVESSWETHVQAWIQVAAELGYPRPLGQTFRRVKGLRDDVVVQRIFNWTQNPPMAKKIAERKAEIYEELLGGRQPAEMLEAKPFLELLHRYDIPVATASALPEKRVMAGLNRHGLKQHFGNIITAEDGGATEIEWYYMYAAQCIQRPPMRCIVIGDSNSTVEAAHELGMKCIVVSGNNPVWDFTAADLVVRDLSQLSFLNLKKLFGEESLVEPRLVENNSGSSSAGSSSMVEQFDEYAGSDDYGDEGAMDSGASSKGMAFYR